MKEDTKLIGYCKVSQTQYILSSLDEDVFRPVYEYNNDRGVLRWFTYFDGSSIYIDNDLKHIFGFYNGNRVNIGKVIEWRKSYNSTTRLDKIISLKKEYMKILAEKEDFKNKLDSLKNKA